MQYPNDTRRPEKIDPFVGTHWKKRSNGRTRGFTIVELLIVIVVIGILAAITIVAYNGIQDRANNATTINGIAQYTKLFQFYANDNGSYPSTASYPCLDTSASGGCARTVSGSPGCGFSGLAPYDASFFSKLSSYAAQMPSISKQTMSCNGDTYRGSYVNANSTDTKNLSMNIFFKGNFTCPQTIGLSQYNYRNQADQTTDCNYTMPTLP
jgi:prepilin-type N-terminal cleavage/methylation domain-containing protein